jgi:alpha-L-fucosidase 2
MEWKNGKLTKAIINSTVGGNCRVRTNETKSVQNVALKEISNKNSNHLFQFINTEKPIINTDSAMTKLPEIGGLAFEFDTKKGGKYIIK